MPHCIIEYSKGLSNDINMNQFMKILNEIIFSSDLFDKDSIKIRAIEHENYFLSSQRQHFIHISLRILSGRTDEQKEELAQKIQTCLSSKFNGQDISLSTEICDIDQKSYQRS